MAEISVTTMSSKGQIVIPVEMRQGFHDGEKFIIMKAENRLILKSAEEFDKNIEEDLRFAKRTEEAWKRYERGEFRSMPASEFLKELEKC